MRNKHGVNAQLILDEFGIPRRLYIDGVSMEKVVTVNTQSSPCELSLLVVTFYINSYSVSQEASDAPAMENKNENKAEG